jgi:hypothetical protein
MGNALHRYQRSILAVLLGLVIPAVSVSAKTKDKHLKQTSAQDRIDVVAHLPLTGSVHQFLATKHYSRDYLYAQYSSGETVALIDTTNPEHPAVLTDVTSGEDANYNLLLTAAGSVALVADSAEPARDTHPGQTIRILSFADPKHPTVQQEFKNVSAITRDDRRGLVFLANDEGLWILRQHFAPDPAVEEWWEQNILANH